MLYNKNIIKDVLFWFAGCFSFHPLKNLNVTNDGGIICKMMKNLIMELARNHGLIDRNTCIDMDITRLDTIQAVVAKYILDNKLENNKLKKKKCRFSRQKS